MKEENFHPLEIFADAGRSVVGGVVCGGGVSGADAVLGGVMGFYLWEEGMEVDLCFSCSILGVRGEDGLKRWEDLTTKHLFLSLMKEKFPGETIYKERN